MLSEKESLLISLKRDVENEDMNSASGVSDDETEEIPKTSGLFFTFAAILLAVGIISVILYFAIFRNIIVLGGGILLMVIGFIGKNAYPSEGKTDREQKGCGNASEKRKMYKCRI